MGERCVGVSVPTPSVVVQFAPNTRSLNFRCAVFIANYRPHHFSHTKPVRSPENPQWHFLFSNVLEVEFLMFRKRSLSFPSSKWNLKLMHFFLYLSTKNSTYPLVSTTNGSTMICIKYKKYSINAYGFMYSTYITYTAIAKFSTK